MLTKPGKSKVEGVMGYTTVMCLKQHCDLAELTLKFKIDDLMLGLLTPVFLSRIPSSS